MSARDHTDLLDELDDGFRCWCDRLVEECEEAGGCRWTRELADRERQVRAKVAEEARRWAREFAESTLDDFADEITRGGQ